MPDASPLIYLAPMSGVTDAPFRAAVRAYGVGTLVSEMVASIAMMETMRDTRKLRHVFDPETPTVLQLAGYEAGMLARAVDLAQDRGAQAIDLNFGCPARKVTGKAAGSALMRDPALCRAIFAAVGAVARVPWSVKMRLGWDHSNLNAPELAAAAVNQGASQITVHARTRCQFYKGQADWTAVQSVSEAIDVPLIINGDIHTAADADRAMAAAKADGYMVGRAVTGFPWALRQIELTRQGRVWAPSYEEQSAAHAKLLEDMLCFYGTELGLKSYRKHLAPWLNSWLGDCDQRRRLLTAQDPAVLFAFFAATDGRQSLAA